VGWGGVESKFLIFFKFSLKLFSKTDNPGGASNLQTLKKCVYGFEQTYALTPIFPHSVCMVPEYSFRKMCMLNIDVRYWLIKRNI